MSRITHFKIQPKNIQYWDYYVLCHLDVYAAIALQRFEYWDGTKSGGNVHAEDINDILESIEEEMTQDTSRFFYKSQDELQWELMGLTGEKYTANLINFLTKDLNYLEQRNNPTNGMDRKKQYLFHDELVQDHINYLAAIVDYFKRLGLHLNPVYYAIEQLTAAKIYIDTLNIAQVADKLAEMYVQMEEDEEKVKDSKKYKPVLPKFIRIQLHKDTDLFPRLKENKLRRFRNFAEWKTQICGMEDANLRNANGKNAESIPQECGSNSNNYKQRLQTVTTDSDYRQKECAPGENSQQDTSLTHSPSLSSQSLSSEETKPKAPSKKKTEEPKGPPIMPPADAPWSRETAVQIVEAKKGRPYSSATRKQELAEAGKVLEMTMNGTSITREQFEYAWDDLASSGWWEEHGKPPMIKYLRRDDSIITILNKRNKKSGSSAQRTITHSNHGTASHDGYTKEERLALLKMSSEDRKMYNQRRREEKERNAVASASYSSQA